MNEVNLHWIFELEYDYEPVEYEVPLTASTKILVDENDPEFSNFIDWVIYFCEEYGLTYAGNHVSECGSLYYDFYNFDNEANCHVNLIIEVRISNHWHKSGVHMKRKQRKVARVMNEDKNDLPELYPVDIMFNRQKCKTFGQGYIRLQLELRAVNDMYGLIK